jgi:uncharacterized protein
MGRNRIRRQVQGTPAVKEFRPFGRLEGRRDKVSLSLDEFEAIRLLDYLHLTQEEAAVRMQVSRPTLTRIYENARVKFATALVEGSTLLIEGGDIKLNKHVYLCEDCGAFTETDERYIFHCPKCLSPHVISLDECYQNQCKECRICYQGGKNAQL